MDIYDEGSFEEMLGTDYEDDIIKHYGTPRRSGRYPWGSGENPYQHEDWWLNEYRKYKDQGLSETEIAKKFNISTTILRDKRKAAQEADYVARVTYVRKMLSHGYTPTTLSKLIAKSETEKEKQHSEKICDISVYSASRGSGHDRLPAGGRGFLECRIFLPYHVSDRVW